MFIYKLLLIDGTEFECDKPWPGTDGKPYTVKGADGKETPHPAHIWLIMFFPDTVESYVETDDDGVDTHVSENTPAHYKVMMRFNRGSGFEKADETQIYTVPRDKVKFSCEVWKLKDALEEFEELFGDVPNNGKAQEPALKVAPLPEG